MRGAEAAERHDLRGDAAIVQLRGQIVEWHQRIHRHQRLELAVQCADETDRVLAALLFGLHPHSQLRRLLGDVGDAACIALQDHIPHLLRFLDRAHLGGKEDQFVGLRGTAKEWRGQQRRRRQCEPVAQQDPSLHVVSPHRVKSRSHVGRGRH